MNKANRPFTLFLILSAGLLVFVAGVALSFFRLPPALWVETALEGGKVWMDALLHPLQHAGRADDAVLRRQVTWNKDKAFNGYTLLTLGNSTTAYLVDMDGNVVFTWSAPFENVWPHAKHIHYVGTELAGSTMLGKAKLLPNGDLLAVYEGIGDTPYGYGLAKIDRHGKAVWTYDDNMHHDLYIDKENGNIYGLSHALVDNHPLDSDDIMRRVLMDTIVTLSPQGKELDRLPVIDAFLNSPYRLLLTSQIVNQEWDVMHTNSIVKLEPSMAAAFPLFKPGQLLVSVRNPSILAVVDPKTRAVVWAYGGLWKHQHSARFLPNGHILLFDNECYEVDQRTNSCIVEFDPNRLAVAWSYEGSVENPFFSKEGGSVERLPNGNSLILEAHRSRIFEVTPDKELAWEYKLPRTLITETDPGGKEKEVIEVFITSATRYTADELPFLKQLPPAQAAKDHPLKK